MVDKPADLDVACVLGMGFPSYRGGLIHWADHVGAARIAAKLNKARGGVAMIAVFVDAVLACRQWCLRAIPVLSAVMHSRTHPCPHPSRCAHLPVPPTSLSPSPSPQLAEVFPEHAGFFRPCEYLASAAQTGRPLSAGAGQGAALAARL